MKRMFLVVVLLLTSPALFLTWQQDPTTTMTIDWHTQPADGERATLVQHRTLGEEAWIDTRGSAHPFPHSDRTIHRVELTQLEPATTYEFRFGKDSVTYRFATLPTEIREPLRFAAGGDVGRGELAERMNRVVMRYDPAFIVWGGDLAYADGDPKRAHIWYQWFDSIKETLIHEDGRVVPIVVAIGNHELFADRRLLRTMSEEEAQAWMQEHGVVNNQVTYFFDLFAFPGKPAYNVLDVGDYLSLVILDSGHHSSITGEQVDWLEKVLQQRAGRPHIFPVYHVPAYPSQRAYRYSNSANIREYWVPLFERFGVRVALENHDHIYKRTHPMLADEVHPAGIVFLGDGGWGVGPSNRGFTEPEQQDRYLNRSAQKRNAIIVTLHHAHQHFLAVSDDGEVIDEYPRTPRRR